MSNSFFSFKLFTIYQDKCAMKVCTDACILGAWFANKVSGYERILDIGSGTGLQMLLLAQKSNALIHGIELDKEAFAQAKENIERSNWKERLMLEEGDVRQHTFKHPFDFIISNPPFFENDLESETDAEKIAKHSTSLTLTTLLDSIANNLDSKGSFGILLPFHRWKYFDALAKQKGFQLAEKLIVKQTLKHKPFRAILHYTKTAPDSITETELVIKPDGLNYSNEFENLLKDYYLKL